MWEFWFRRRSSYALTGSIVTVRYKHPRVTPTRGAPSFLNDPEYRSNGIVSLIVAVMWEEKSEPGPPPPVSRAKSREAGLAECALPRGSF